jgi:hypothetical protein
MNIRIRFASKCPGMSVNGQKAAILFSYSGKNTAIAEIITFVMVKIVIFPNSLETQNLQELLDISPLRTLFQNVRAIVAH